MIKWIVGIAVYLLLVLWAIALCGANHLNEEEEDWFIHEDDILDAPEDVKIYISGAITNTPFAWSRFNYAKEQLQLMGFRKIINPQPIINLFTYEADYNEYMQVALTLLSNADAIYMLEGWMESFGACREYEIATKKGIIIIYEDELDIAKLKNQTRGGVIHEKDLCENDKEEILNMVEFKNQINKEEL